MQRSRLKNIINKSKTISNKQEVGNPFDKFKKSLPIEIDDNYRLEAAWKAYGSPKDYKTALWYGMIQPIDENNYKLPSIGYNEETDEYEYLNKGEDNETVAKDIRVWDNDVIPLVKELKLGGYVRLFNKEKDCWTYSKNIQERKRSSEDKGEQVIDSFKNGGKPKSEFNVPSDIFEIDKNGDYLYWGDDDRAIEWLKNNKDFTKQYKQWGEPKDGEKTRLVNKKRYDQLWFDKNKDRIFKLLMNSEDYSLDEYPFLTPDGNPAKISEGRFTPEGEQLYETPDRQLYTMKQGGKSSIVEGYKDFKEQDKVKIKIKNSPGYVYLDKKDLEDQDKVDGKKPIGELNLKKLYLINGEAVFEDEIEKFKQGGQMNVIPEGALHARKNNMELAKEGEVTHKGVPVVDNDGVQQAEVEKEEWTMTKELTEDVEEWYKKYYDEETSQKEKDELAIKCGKRITKELLHNTDDRANLIAKMLEEEE